MKTFLPFFLFASLFASLFGAYVPPNPNGQVSATGSAPVTISRETASGNITTQNLVPAGTATAGSAVEISLYGASGAMVQTTGTYTGALSLQVTVDGSNWVTVGGTPFINVTTGGSLATITSALQSAFKFETGGAAKARITGLAAMTGTATVSLSAIVAQNIVAIVAPLPAGTASIGVVDTEAPAAAALADGASNPTTPLVGSPSLNYNGTNWDRVRNNFNTTTGDTGAKTATGNGATQVNYNAKGAHILFNVGTVSGTTPTCTFKLQGSADTGTTWYDIPGASTASLTATGTALLTVYPGATVAANAAVSYPLPRTWRVVWTIGGTSPSFTITNVQVAYIN